MVYYGRMNIRKNAPLIAGLAIPVVMVLLVAASIYLPALFAPAPVTNFLYMTGSQYYYGDQYSVDKGRLLKIKPDAEQKPYGPPNNQIAHFYTYNVSTNTRSEISFEDAQKLTLDSSVTSPDGFQLKNGTQSDGFAPFFVLASEDYRTHYLVGHGASYKLGIEQGTAFERFSNDFQFLGWIIN